MTTILCDGCKCQIEWSESLSLAFPERYRPLNVGHTIDYKQLDICKTCFSKIITGFNKVLGSLLEVELPSPEKTKKPRRINV